MTALEFIEAICETAGLSFEFTGNTGIFTGDYVQLVFRQASNPPNAIILWYTIKYSVRPLSGDCSACGTIGELGDAELADLCLQPVMQALEEHSDLVELKFCGGYMTKNCKSLFSASGKSFNEILVEIGLNAR